MKQKTINCKIHEIRTEEELSPFMTLYALVEFLNENMKPYQDECRDIQRGIEYAFSREPGKGGFVLLAESYGMPVGALVMLNTGMGGYVPENLLLFVSVHESARNAGIGGNLVCQALKLCKGDVKLHVEFHNPAKRLYEKLGFASKYAEMRYYCESPQN
ncbi:MAG: GNAT family N-acetyltransferase [Fibrobacterota bacterium]